MAMALLMSVVCEQETQTILDFQIIVSTSSNNSVKHSIVFFTFLINQGTEASNQQVNAILPPNHSIWGKAVQEKIKPDTSSKAYGLPNRSKGYLSSWSKQILFSPKKEANLRVFLMQFGLLEQTSRHYALFNEQDNELIKETFWPVHQNRYKIIVIF